MNTKSQPVYVLCVLLALGATPITVEAQQVPSSADVGRIVPFQASPLDSARRKKLVIPELDQSATAPEQAASIRFILQNVSLDGMTVFDSESIKKKFYADLIDTEVGLDIAWKIAAEITNHYRQKGYFLSRAYVPAQSIENGILTISVAEGYIADIVLDDPLADTALLKQYKKRLLATKPLRAEKLESFMLALNDLPGQQFSGTIQPYPEVAAAVSLVLKRQDTSANASLTLDNYGSRFLGPYQATLSASDSLIPLQQTTLTALGSIPFDELHYIGGSHKVPFYPDWKFILSSSYVSAKPGASLAPSNIQSDSVQLSLGLQYQAIRQRSKNLIFTVELDGRNTNGDILDGNPLTRDRIRTARLRGEYDWGDDWYGTNYMSLQFNQGLSIFGASDAGALNLSRAEADPDFSMMQLYAMRQQYIGKDWLGIAHVSGQAASAPLFSAEEFGIGGQRFGRAYDPSEITGDHGIAGALELRYTGLEVTPNINIVPYAFYDHGVVWNEDRGAQRESASSAGFGFYGSHTSGLSANLGVAWPLTRKVSTPISGHEKNPRLLMQLGYRF